MVGRLLTVASLAALLAGGCSSDDPKPTLNAYEGDEAGECEDGADNDKNGLFDCKDPGCTGAPVCAADDADVASSPEDVTPPADTATPDDDVPPMDTADDTGPPPEDTPVVSGQDPCPALGPAEGNIIEVTPDQAVDLPGIVLTAPPGSTLLFADGTYNVNGDIWITIDSLTLRSASGDRDKVILDANYTGGSVIVVAASNVTIADMTLRRAYYHGLHFRPPASAAAHVMNPVAYNVRIHNPRQQGIKVNQEGDWFVDNGVIACSDIELDGEGRPVVEGCYTGGIDAHRTRGWHIRDNTIRGFWCNSGLSEHAIHMWRRNAETIIERNVIENCARGIGLGLAHKSDGADRQFPDIECAAVGHVDDYNGLVRNNTVFASEAGLFASQSGFDTGIALWSACNARVYHNTVYSTQAPFSSVEWRFAGTVATIKNNLVSHKLVPREDAVADLEGNLEEAPAALFEDAAAGKLHLVDGQQGAIDAGVPLAAGEADEDIDGEPRDDKPDRGADER